MLDKVIHFSIHNKLVIGIFLTSPKSTTIPPSSSERLISTVFVVYKWVSRKSVLDLDHVRSAKKEQVWSD